MAPGGTAAITPRGAATHMHPFLLALTLVVVAAAEAPPPCVPLPITVQVEPWRATLSWGARVTPSPFFVEYRAGKFPTQVETASASGEATVSVTVENLVPGRSYVVQVCEPRIAGGCPAHDPGRGCTTEVTVAVPLAHPGVTVRDDSRPQCTTEPGVVYDTRGLGGPDTGSVETSSAEACCDACAAAEPRLPYRDACRFFSFDERTRECVLASGRGERRPSAGIVSGRVVAWPRVDVASPPTVP